MRRALKIALLALATIAALPLLLVGLVLVLGNTAPGRRLIEQQTERLSGGTVVLAGLAGRFPDRLRLAHAELRDAAGAWLTIDGLALDWSPLLLLAGEARVEQLVAAHIALPRLAAPAPAGRPASGGGAFRLPVSVTLRAVSIARLDLGAPLAGAPAVLRLSGTARLAALDNGSAGIVIDRLDAPGAYRLSGRIDPGEITATISAAEPAHGLLATAARLPALGALTLQADIAGPRDAEATRIALHAGGLAANLAGRVDLVHRAADLDLTARAPAMAPRADLAWQSVALVAHLHGPFATPQADARAEIIALAAGGAELRSLRLDATGDRGAADLHSVLEGLRIPGPKPDLFAAAPLDLRAHAVLDTPDRPVSFTLHHPLLSAEGRADTGGALSARVRAVVPDLAPLAAVGGVHLTGRTDVTASLATAGPATRVAVDGSVGVTGGLAPVPALIGPAARIAVRATLTEGAFALEEAAVDARSLWVRAQGSDRGGALALDWQVKLADLAALSPGLAGRLAIAGRLEGPQTGITATATATGMVGSRDVRPGAVQLAVRVANLPRAPRGEITAGGRLDAAPLTLAASFDRNANGMMHVLVRRADWKSAQLRADLTLASGAKLPEGSLALQIARLADLRPLLGTALTGSIEAHLAMATAAGRAQARLAAAARDIAVPGAAIGGISLAGTIDDPAARPRFALRLAAQDVAAGGVTGAAELTADGPETALLLRLGAALHHLGGADATATAAARLDAASKTLDLTALAADYRSLPLRLLGPARLDFGGGLGVDHLRLGLRQAQLTVAGRLSPRLDMTLALRNLTADLARPFLPGLAARGVVTADAHLTGSTAQPAGELRLAATDLQLQSAAGRAIPPATLQASALLAGDRARITTRLGAGPRVRLALDGVAPLAPTGILDLHAAGVLDLGLANPILAADGRQVRGTLGLDATIGGRLSAPRLSGQVTLARGEIQDFVQGAHLTDISALLVAAGDTLRIVHLSATAGPGTINAAGSIGVLAPGLPVDLTLHAANARPLASDMLTATLDADLALHGSAGSRLAADGHVHIRRAEINIPSSFPPSVAVLDVRRPGEKPPPPARGAGVLVALGLVVDAPGAIFVRGHGLDAELGGTLRVGGTSAAPQIGGGFDLRRGSFSLAGTTLSFTRGRVGFNGTGVRGKIDPTLDFEADSLTSNITAVLKITGYADAPKITLSSTPPLPQDQILAQLLFGQSITQLSALQVAEIAAALAEIGGVGGGGGALDRIRKSLGLDRLSVGGGTNGTGASVEAGRYVARGIYVGARQGTSGTTQAQVQVDLTRHLKLQSQLATGGGTVQGATPQDDPGSNIGITYQFDY